MISTKNNPNYLFIFLFMWFIIYFIQLFKNYKYKEINNIEIKTYYITKKKKNDIKDVNPYINTVNFNHFVILSNIQSILFIVSLIFLSIGFITYYKLKRKEYKKNWSIINFIFL